MASNSLTNVMQSRQRRLKGFLALLPETGTRYPSKRDPSQFIDPLSSPYESSLLPTTGICTKKITSRKQQRRLLKRCQRDGGTSSTDMEQGEGSFQSISVCKEAISLVDHLYDMDVAVLFLFDPYQPYSLHLLQKLIALSRLTCSATAVESVDPPLDKNHNGENDSPHGIAANYGAMATSSQPQNVICTDMDAVAEGVEQDFPVTQRSPQLHCLVVTPCMDIAIVDRLLDNSGVILIPWTQDHSAWRMATGSHVCPSIVGVYECRLGQYLFTAHLEELALEWNTSAQVQRAWLHDRMSAMTFMQRIQSYALHPTPSTCIIQ